MSLLAIFIFQCSICSAVDYSCATYSAPPTGFRSTSAYSTARPTPSSLSAISAANYEALNSEGGACYHGASGPHRGRATGDDNSKTGLIGGYDFDSPIGDIPWYLFGVLAAIYGLIIQKKRT